MILSWIVHSSCVWTQTWLWTCQHNSDLEKATWSVTQFGVHWKQTISTQSMMIPEAEARKKSSFFKKTPHAEQTLAGFAQRTQMPISYSPFSLDRWHPITLSFSKRNGVRTTFLCWLGLIQWYTWGQDFSSFAAYFRHLESLTKFPCPGCTP